MVDVAQLVRAPVCGTGGRGFEPHYPPHSISRSEDLQTDVRVVSSVVEHLTFNQVATGSSPVRPTKNLLNRGLFFFAFQRADSASAAGARLFPVRLLGKCRFLTAPCQSGLGSLYPQTSRLVNVQIWLCLDGTPFSASLALWQGNKAAGRKKSLFSSTEFRLDCPPLRRKAFRFIKLHFEVLL